MIRNRQIFPRGGSTYLRILERRKIPPNFWTSEEYFTRSNWYESSFDHWVWIEDKSGRIMLPPVTMIANIDWNLDLPMGVDYVWSDFKWYSPNRLHPTFLDWEYIYNPLDFRDLSGGKWMTFRKNVRKWPKDRKNIDYTARIPNNDQIENVFTHWIINKIGTNLYDPEMLTQYIFSGPLRSFLYEGDRLVGINAWDTNYQYINFRYSICLNEPFLSEYLRYRFYTDAWGPGCLVNDGGSLGVPGLEAFKNKLNPMQKRAVNSWGTRKELL